MSYLGWTYTKKIIVRFNYEFQCCMGHTYAEKLPE